MKFTLGADPEIFLVNQENQLISAVGKIGGTKTKPKPLPIGDGFAVQEDNVALEYNIPPADTIKAFNGNILRAMSYLSDYVSTMGLKFVNSSSEQFPMDQLMTSEAITFGCDPDFNAWMDGFRNPRPVADDPQLRSCGGHVHIGAKFNTKKDVIEFTKYCDLFLGVASVIMDGTEQSLRRRQLYGQPGSFRYKPFGMEYRSLSNFWVFDSKYINWVWNSVERALDAWQNKKIDIESARENILMCMNTNNVELAKQMVDDYNLIVV